MDSTTLLNNSIRRDKVLTTNVVHGTSTIKTLSKFQSIIEFNLSFSSSILFKLWNPFSRTSPVNAFDDLGIYTRWRMYDMKLLREKSLCIAISHCFMYCFHTVMACVALVSIKTICVLFPEKYFFVIYWEKINKTTIFHSCEFVILVEIHVT